MSASESITVGSAGWGSHGQVLNDVPGSKKGEQSGSLQLPDQRVKEMSSYTKRGNQCQGGKINTCPLQAVVQQ